MSSWAAISATLSITAIAGACGPRVVLSRSSHNGQLIAYVSDATVVDGPTHTMYLRTANGTVLTVFELPVDNEGGSDIVWTADDRRLGLLSYGTDGAYFRLFDSADGQLLAKSRLAESGVDIRELHFGADAMSVVFLECPRVSRPCVPRAVQLSPNTNATTK